MYKLCPKYNGQDTSIIRLSDNIFIPFDPANVDYQKYLEWLSQGNQPEQPDA